MAWPYHIDDRRTQRLLQELARQAIVARDIAQDRLGALSRESGHEARRAAHAAAGYGRDAAENATAYGRQVADDFVRTDGAELAREAARHYARRAGELAIQLADYGRHEGAVLARTAAARARRAGRAVRSDPMPLVIGAVGVVLLASLLLGHRRG